MNVSTRPSFIADAIDVRSDPSVVWHYPVFCQLALPMVLTPTPWHRVTDGLQLVFEASSGSDHEVPSGWALHSLLIRLCDQAVRTDSPAVELGADAAALAASLGLPADEAVLLELRAQIERLVVGKQSAAWEQQPLVGVFDARAQRYQSAVAWRPRLRLSDRFHASLMQQAVPLNRSIITTLAAEPLALDAYGWIRHQLQHQAAGQSTTTEWPELLCRFGSPDQEEQDFRAAFEDALRIVFAVDFSISLAADEDGVTVSALPPEAAAAAAQAARPQPHPSPALAHRTAAAPHWPAWRGLAAAGQR